MSFSPRMGRVQGCHSVLGWGEYTGVIQSLGSRLDSAVDVQVSNKPSTAFNEKVAGHVGSIQSESCP